MEAWNWSIALFYPWNIWWTCFGGSDTFLYTVDTNTGQSKWKHQIDHNITSSTFSNGVVFFGSLDNITSRYSMLYLLILVIKSKGGYSDEICHWIRLKVYHLIFSNIMIFLRELGGSFQSELCFNVFLIESPFNSNL